MAQPQPDRFEELEGRVLVLEQTSKTQEERLGNHARALSNIHDTLMEHTRILNRQTALLETAATALVQIEIHLSRSDK